MSASFVFSLSAPEFMRRISVMCYYFFSYILVFLLMDAIVISLLFFSCLCVVSLECEKRDMQSLIVL
jgi:hypothetical protein